MSEQITPNPSVPTQVVQEMKFPKMINNLGIIPTSYKDSMSYYECLAWLCKFLEESVIPTLNENGEAVEELQELYVELNNYVAHYFDTLDVQEEINNKLDDMVEQGTLQEIIADYLNSKAVFGFDTVEDMKEATNLINGSYAKTLGYYEINDFGSGLYKIRNRTLADNVDEKFIIEISELLIAELLYDTQINAECFGISNLEDLNSVIQSNKINKIIINKDYNINETLIMSNIEIDFNNYQINGKSDLLYHITMNNNSKLRNANIIFENSIILDYGNFIQINGNNIEITGCNINGYRGITCSKLGTVENIKIDNNIFNCKRFQVLLHTSIFNNIIISNNKQTIPQTWTSPATAEICFCICNGFKWVPDSAEITSEILDNPGSNYYIYNNSFNQINARAFDISNAKNVKIENNYCYNLVGDKSTVGISDDVFVLQFCKYSNVSYNKVENSGENACDLLSCQYCNVTNNEFINCDGYAIDLNNADLYTRGWTDNTVTINYLESSYNNIENNIIGILILGVGIRNGRNNNIKGNTFYLESNNTDNVAVFLTGVEPFETSIANYGTTYIDNNHTDNIRNYCNKSSIYIASKIILGENDHHIYKLTVDNSTLATDNSVKMYDAIHNLKFNNARFYYIYDSKKYYLQPEYILNTDHDTYYGISNIQFFDYRCYVFLYKHFLPLQQSNKVSSFYNVTSGDLYLELW